MICMWWGVIVRIRRREGGRKGRRAERNNKNHSDIYSSSFFTTAGHGTSWCALDMCRLAVPRLPGSYTGTGDLTAALLIASPCLPPSLPPSLRQVMVRPGGP